MELPVEVIAQIYKKRWQIELLFYGKHIVMQSDTIKYGVIN
jgi:IS4 transposase